MLLSTTARQELLTTRKFWPSYISDLCKVKIVRVCLLSSQPHRDEDDDGSTGCWLVILRGGRGVWALRRGLPCCWCPVAIDDISTVHYGGSITEGSDGGLLSVSMSLLSVCMPGIHKGSQSFDFGEYPVFSCLCDFVFNTDIQSFSFSSLSAKLSEYMLVFFLERAKKEFVTSVIDVTCELLYSQSFKMNRKHLFLSSLQSRASSNVIFGKYASLFCFPFGCFCSNISLRNCSN